MPRISKKVRMENMKEDLNNSLILALGYTVNDDGYVLDQDTNLPVTMDNRYIKTIKTATNRDVAFDPLMNKRLITKLFTSLLSRDSKENGVYYKSFYGDIEKTPDRENISSLVLETDRGVIITKHYLNDTLKYIEAIFYITSFKYDLTPFDVDEFKRR